MRNLSQQTLSGSPLVGIFCAALAILGLIVAGERSGLPVQWSEWFLRIVLGLALAFAIWFGKTAVETQFFGRQPITNWQGGGFVLGMILFSAGRLIPGANAHDLWLPCILGTVAGLFCAHRLTRYTRHVSATQKMQTLANDPAPVAIRLALGGALSIFGLMLALGGLQSSLPDLVAAWGGTQGNALVYALLIVLTAVTLGGANGALTLSSLLALIAAGGVITSVFIGFVTFGAIPLPGYDNPQSLKAIAAVKQEWGLDKSLFLQSWPALADIFGLDGLTSLVLSALVSLVVSLWLAPAVQVRRRSVFALAAFYVVALPLLIIAINGYAIEAAAEFLIGRPVTRPSLALLETTRLGLISICGGLPETAEALRLQCGVNPRDTTLLEASQLKPVAGYLSSGLAVVLGFTSAIGLSLRFFPSALALIGIVVGIWIFSIGLGRYILGRQREAPGLASYRIALMRISAVIGCAILALVINLDLVPSIGIRGVVSGISALLVVLIQLVGLRSSKATPRQTAQTA